MGWGSPAGTGTTSAKELDALKNPFKLIGRTLSGAVKSVDPILRGLWTVGNTVSKEVSPLRQALAIRRGEEFTPGKETLDQVLKPIAKSFVNTASTATDIAPFSVLGQGRRIFGDREESDRRTMQRLQELNDDPFMFGLEHIGNTAIFGAAIAKPAQLGVAASRGAIPAASIGRGLRPVAGRGIRNDARLATAQAAREGSPLAQMVHVTDDLIGHPYRSTYRAYRDSNFRALLKNPRVFDSVTGAGPRVANTGETLARTGAKTLEEGIDAFPSSEVSLPVPDPAARMLSSAEQTIANRGLNPPEQLAQAAGFALEGMRKSQGYQKHFGPDARGARQVMEDLRKAKIGGLGRVGEAVKKQFPEFTETLGNRNLQRKWEPSRVERLFHRDLKGLAKRPDRERWTNVTEQLDFDKITPGSIPSRVAQVGTGKRVTGQTVTPTDLVNQIDLVLREAQRQAGDVPVDVILKEMLPGVDPMGMYLMGLNALERVHGLPNNSLTAALGDFVTMDRFGDLNRQAQAAMRAADQSLPDAATARFRIPDEHLNVDINALPHEAQRMFYDAAAQYRRELATGREPVLAEGLQVIPPGGTRIGRAADEPTRFPTSLEDLPLTSEWRQRLRSADKDQAATRKNVDELANHLEELRSSGRPLTRVDPEAQITYRKVPDTPAENAGNLNGASIRQADAFDALAKAQRAAPEQIMVQAQHLIGGGELSYLLEHVGDITNRMAKRTGPGFYGHLDVQPKITRAAGILNNPNLTSFIEQSLQSHYRYLTETGMDAGQGAARQKYQGTFDDFKAEVTAKLEEYAVAHRELPVYNETQRMARDAAVAVGRMDFDTATTLINELAKRVETPQKWAKAAGEFDVPAPRQPTRASMERKFKPTQTQKAIDRTTKRLVDAKIEMAQAVTRYNELENLARVDPANAPASARNLLNYANEVAPAQARILRQMAKEGVGGDPQVLKTLADELDAIPRTLEDLNSADVYLAYLKDMKDRGTPVGSPSSPGRLSTVAPGGTRRRGTELDMDFSRDFRARAYWQDAEFQGWLMAQQADKFAHQQGLVKTGADRLREAGFTDAQIKKLTPNQAQQAMERLGLRAYEPDKFYGTARKPSTGNALEAEWITPFAEAQMMKAIREPGFFEKVLMEGLYDPGLNAWKVWALPLRFGWQVNNYAGNAILSIMRGQVSPFDYQRLMQASTEAVRSWNQGVPHRVRVPLTDLYRSHLVAKLNTNIGPDQRTLIQSMLDDNHISLPNHVLSDIAANGLTKGDFAFLNDSVFLRDIGAKNRQNILEQFDIKVPSLPGRLGERASNLRQTGREIVDIAYHLNETVDNFHRVMVYIDQIGKGASHTEALAMINGALADYSKLSGFERRVIKRIYPFYPWMRHITEVVAGSFKPDNIARTTMFMHLTNIMGQPNEWEAMLPEWASGHIYMGMSEEGTPEFLSTRGLNPFLDVFDPLAQPNMRGLLRPITPPVQFAYEQISGTSVLTGRPFSSPGQPFGGGAELARPPVSEYPFRNIPQLGAARNVYRDLMGQPLTRYGTGEPAFFEGAEEGRSGLQSVRQLFGVNLRPLDVADMQKRDQQREKQSERALRRYQRQVEKHGGNRLRDIVNPFGG